MCGRFASQYTWREIHAFSAPIGVEVPASDPEPAFNIAPTQSAWVLIPQANGALKAVSYRWGLIPHWAKDSHLGFASINARLESIASKPTFRLAWRQRRCLVPVSGYFEWTGSGADKTPFYVYATDAPVLMLGGVYERWQDADGVTLDSFSIVTTAATGAIAALHDRMPVILPANALRAWLNLDAESAGARALALPPPALAFHAVSRAVGNVRKQGRELIAPMTRLDAALPMRVPQVGATVDQLDLFAPPRVIRP
jgi:putative SOS response-associated peptidase YedK